MRNPVLSALALCCAIAAPAHAATVVVDSGTLAGTSDGATDIYKGIPYAAPPVGPLRWKPPTPAEHWTEPRDATQFGASCPQPPHADLLAGGTDQPKNEDCLFLNVWTPHGALGAPVMVWIHGGSNRTGLGSAPLYDGRAFARDGVILVTLNYRLGQLGFFAHPALTKEAAAGAPLGNYGLMDQIAALQWVQHNITAFGGDPDNVTVFGESAGGEDILYLLATPSAKGLFARAIVESGGGWFLNPSLSDREAEGAAFASRAGLADATADALRALPVEKTLDIGTVADFGPFADGRLVPESPTLAFADGSANDVPLIIGSNDFEASLIAGLPASANSLVSRLTPEARLAYRGEYASDAALAGAVFTDAVMGAPAHWIAARESSSAPSFLYHFSYVANAFRSRLPGAPHASEVPYVFANGADAAARFGVRLSDEDLAMESLVHACWIGFAKTGRPGCGGWQSFDPATDVTMEFSSTPGVVINLRRKQYEALETVLKPSAGLRAPHR